LSHDPALSVWETSDGEWLCGQAEWKGFPRSDSTSEGRPLASGRLDEFKRFAIPGKDYLNVSLKDIIPPVFAWVRRPLELDELVNIIGELWQIQEPKQTTRVEEEDSGLPSSSGASQSTLDQLEIRRYLKHLWMEICELPSGQRMALLFNLRDGNGEDGLDLFHLTGTATLEQIASSMQISLNEFWKLWPTLPLDDLAIAQRMNLTRQQVINLRKSARQRLGRRMRGFDREPSK